MKRDFLLPNRKKKEDLEKIKLTAKDWIVWRQISEIVCKAAEAEITRNSLAAITIHIFVYL